MMEACPRVSQTEIGVVTNIREESEQAIRADESVRIIKKIYWNLFFRRDRVFGAVAGLVEGPPPFSGPVRSPQTLEKRASKNVVLR